MPNLLDIQIHRGVLLINNLVSLIIAFICADTWWRHIIAFDVLGVFLIVSWIQSAIILIYVWRTKRLARKAGYFRVPVNGDLRARYDNDEQPEMSLMTVAIVSASDIICLVPIMITMIVSFTIGETRLQVMASVGGIVACFVHVFMLCAALCYGFHWRYRLKVTWVRRGREERSVATHRSKEQHSREDDQSIAESETEQLSPRPYRGSPSNKPTPKSSLSTNSPIKLVDPSEGDALIADHD